MNAVIFDMDGLMFDTERVFYQAWDYAGEQMGLGKTGYMVLKTMGMNKIMTNQVWIEEFGEKYDEQELRKFSKEFLSKYYSENKVPVKKGLYVILDYLKQNSYKMAVCSSTPKWEVEHHLKDAGVFEYFQAIICGDMVEKSKPEPDIYLKACDAIGKKPKDCYALEDSRNGLLSAHGAGCKAIMVPDLWQPDEEIEQILFGKFNDLEEVTAFLKRQ